MSEPASEKKSPAGSGKPSSSQSSATADWERRAADLANEVQRWLIRQSARNMRDEFSSQMRNALRGPAPSEPSDVWATATTEPPDAASQPPECAWCPICRAARRMAQAQVAGQAGGSGRPGSKPGSGSGSGAGGVGPVVGSTLAGATDAIVGAARDALTGLDAILSYRPGDISSPKPAADSANGTSESAADSSSGLGFGLGLDSDPGPARDSGPARASDSAGDSAADSEPVVDSQPDSSSQAGEHEHEPDHRG